MKGNKAIRNYKWLGFDDRRLRWILIPVVGIIMSMIFNQAVLSYLSIQFVIACLIGIFMTLLYWEGARFFTILFRKRYPDFDQTPKRILLQGLSIVAYTVVISVLMQFLLTISFPSGTFDSHGAPSGIIATFLVVFLFTSIYEGIYFFQNWKTSIIEGERLKQNQLAAQLASLKNQVNPHFFFNSLNTLLGLIGEEKGMAAGFVKHLSAIYRYLLENRKNDLVQLERELKFVRDYLYIQQERFQESLKVEWHLGAIDMLKQVPSLSVLSLIQNCIKHNVISKSKPLIIQIEGDSESLTILNNLQPLSTVPYSTGLGLKNLKKRYSFYSSDKIEISEDSAYFIVKIPLLKARNEVINH